MYYAECLLANKTISMDLMNQIKLLKGLGYGSKTIARDLGMSKNTVKKYLTDSEDPPEDRSICQKDSLIGFFPYCRKELSRKGVTRQILWAEYRRAMQPAFHGVGTGLWKSVFMVAKRHAHQQRKCVGMVRHNS